MGKSAKQKTSFLVKEVFLSKGSGERRDNIVRKLQTLFGGGPRRGSSR